MNTPAYDSPVRLAVVGVGQITQQAFLPALRSLDDVELVAAVTGSPEKAAAFGDRVRIHDYGDYDDLLASGTVDAVYVATPVFRHREFAEPALRAGIHVLLEKPMATSVEDCEAMIAASESSGATLMVAYRMHQDAYMVDLVERVTRGEIGETRSFTSVFTHDINEDNHRGQSGFWGGPVPDFGAYPLNLARHLFRAEPVRVHALGTRNDDRDFNFRDTVGVTLRFPDDRIAQYTLSYAADDVDNFTLVGAEGSMTSDSCYGYAPEPPRNVTVTTESGTKTRTAESMDQFAGEIRYFVDCLRSGTRPEPDGEEGLADVRVFAAVEESLRTGAEVILPPRSFGPGLSRDQVRAIPPRPAHEIPDDDELIDQEPQDR